MRRGGDKLRVAANGASIGAPDQKLSRSEAADEQWRIDTESILNRFSVNSLSISTLVKGANELKGVRFRVLNIFVITSMFLFSLGVILDDTKPRIYGVIPVVWFARRLGFTFYPPYLEFRPRNSPYVILQSYPPTLPSGVSTLEISSQSQTQYVRPKLLDLRWSSLSNLGEITLVSAHVGWFKNLLGVRGLPSTFVRTLKSSIGRYHRSWREYSLTPFGSIVLPYTRFESRPYRDWLVIERIEFVMWRIDSYRYMFDLLQFCGSVNLFIRKLESIPNTQAFQRRIDSRHLDSTNPHFHCARIDSNTFRIDSSKGSGNRLDSSRINSFASEKWFHLFKSPSFYVSSILVSPKVLATMSRCKTPVVKLKNVPSKDSPQLSQLPLRKWFANKELWEDYQSFYSKMPILPPRFLNEGLLLEDKYPEFWELLDHQGLRPLLFTRERYYPRMMAAVATTFRVHDGFKYTLDLDQLSSILGLRNSGVLFKGGSEVPKRLTSFDSEIAAQRLRVSRITGKKYSVSAMKTDHRLLQYMLSYIWLPRRGNHRVLTEEDLIILWAMVRKVTLNWSYLIARHLVNCTTSCLVNTGLGHGALWTKIFEHLGVDLSGEEAVLVDDKNAMTTRHLNKMGTGPKAAAERNEDASEGSSHPQNVGSSTHFSPEFMESFTQGMQSLHSSWSKGVQGMDQRLDGYESRLSNLTKEIQELGNDMHRFFSRAAQSENQGPQDGASDQE
ncbi:hypothetical protein PIB30_048075 [Stylosanthes scabra]|uniref:Uncharacterized protein n=1 Tax=Stylosanthes scabra TaxID=79078 RepID=A0ABU6VFE6_9FABA|nr:hypothetical protein [Stylosanthes scabra]